MISLSEWNRVAFTLVTFSIQVEKGSTCNRKYCAANAYVDPRSCSVGRSC